MGYVIAGVLVLLIISGLILFLVMNSMKKSDTADAGDPGADQNPLGIIGSDDGTPAGYPHSDTDKSLTVIRFDDINFSQPDSYEKWASYGQSKTANIYMASSVERHYGSKDLRGLSVHANLIGLGALILVAGLLARFGRRLGGVWLARGVGPWLRPWRRATAVRNAGHICP